MMKTTYQQDFFLYISVTVHELLAEHVNLLRLHIEISRNSRKVLTTVYINLNNF